MITHGALSIAAGSAIASNNVYIHMSSANHLYRLPMHMSTPLRAL